MKYAGVAISGIIDFGLVIAFILFKVNGIVDLNWIWTIVIAAVLLFAVSKLSFMPIIVFIVLKIIGRLALSWWWIIVPIVLFLVQMVAESMIDVGNKFE